MSRKSRITPVSTDYETCAECFVRLMIYPGDIHPSEISNIMHVQPTQITVIGEKVKNSRGVTREVKSSSWFLSSEGNVQSKDLRDHIDWLVREIQPHRESLGLVQQIDGVKITLKCVWFSLLGHSGPVLWPEQMKALADLDLEVSFDVYFVE
ncbi:DUF4279 domain-containing protein [Pseudomonas allii]|uniref:DUF4279 domain-containing protein n=2 Tax=Pseudomonas allii TaxID=2740531 RepID=A0ACC6LFW9_9PSED|nr:MULTISPECIES: DUF4279 domain-containing protein [Pseudomonas]MDR9877203.1 DUF4279 domain-containing protein [Pseudomonas allii]